jgi:hypothetical protein
MSPRAISVVFPQRAGSSLNQSPIAVTAAQGIPERRDGDSPLANNMPEKLLHP